MSNEKCQRAIETKSMGKPEQTLAFGKRLRGRFLSCAVLAAWSAALGSADAKASVSFTNGAGSAVSSVDRQATFDSIGADLSIYAEDSLSITANGYNTNGFDPFLDGTMTGFHYESGGNNEYVTIRGTDSAVFSGIEFKLGSGYSYSFLLVAWETYLHGVLTGSGASIPATAGSIIGWSDPNGFDELRVGASVGGYSFGDPQAIALDNLSAQLAADDNGAVPEPMSLAVWAFLCGGCGAGVVYRRCRLRSL